MPSQPTYNEIDNNDDLLLLLLTPEAVSRTWPDLKLAIEAALPPITNPTQTVDRMTDILESLLTGRLMCHTIYKMVDDQPYAYGIVVTAFLHNVENDQKNLLIYSLYGHPKYITGDAAAKFLNKMKEFARSKGCKALIAYSCIPSVIENISRMGGSTEYRLLTLEVEDE